MTEIRKDQEDRKPQRPRTAHREKRPEGQHPKEGKGKKGVEREKQEQEGKLNPQKCAKPQINPEDEAFMRTRYCLCLELFQLDFAANPQHRATQAGAQQFATSCKQERERVLRFRISKNWKRLGRQPHSFLLIVPR